jgi:transcriptional regulator with XRE-family HTH domain
MSKRPPRADKTLSSTRLAVARLQRNVTQEDLAKQVGLSLASYRRLERGQVRNPGIRTLVNLAVALQVPIDEVCEPEWFEWWDAGAGIGRSISREP